MEIVKETFDKNRLTWEFTQDIVDKVKDLKSSLADYLPEEFRELARMSGEERKERQNKLLRSLAKVLFVDIEKLEPGKEVRISVSKLESEQREYLWRTLHELELMDIIGILQKGTSWTPLIQDFESTEVEVGLYNAPDYEKIHSHPYVRFFRTNPDGSQHSIQLGAIDK